MSLQKKTISFAVAGALAAALGWIAIPANDTATSAQPAPSTRSEATGAVDALGRPMPVRLAATRAPSYPDL